MKRSSTFYVLVFLMIVLTLRMPFTTFAQQNPVKAEAEVAAAQEVYALSLEAKTAAERDASSDLDRDLWWIGGGAGVTLLGCVGGIAGWAVGQEMDPPQGCEVISTGMIVGALTGYGIGVFSSLYGIYNYRGAVPSERLIGKSPEYIEIYTEAYGRKIGLMRATRAGAGAAIIHLSFGMVLLLISGYNR